MSTSPIAFTLPSRLEAHDPPEERGAARDDVRMLVATRSDGRLEDARFRDLPDFLAAGDALVLNTSKTLPAALPARREDGSSVEVHLSTPVPGDEAGRWVVELRRDGRRFRGALAGEVLRLPGGGSAALAAPYASGRRLWAARLALPEPLLSYLANHGRPITYRHARAERPLAAYQTVYATEPGGAEMPSAGRPFTPRMITALVSAGILVLPVVLHAGVSSPEAGEPPFPERYRVPPATATALNGVRAGGGRVVAVGTTVVRALETAAARDGTVAPGEGWTALVVTPERGVRVVDGLLTGWHEPQASHLWMLEALGGRSLIRRSYDAALARGYLWHEFGDVHLILP
jgi:S-adenosylmethionine:tRNA ribosyltransferase-isomerase